MKPLVWLPLDHRHLGDGPQAIPYLFLGEKYASAIKRSALAQPCTFPLASEGDIVDLLEQELVGALARGGEGLEPS